jgi:transcriptional regulator
MYRPAYTQEKDKQQLCELVENYPFVTLISVAADGETQVTHLPVVCEIKDNEIINIRGHIAKANPHYQTLLAQQKVKVIFHGPHLYVSPLWYKSGRDVPTWNYAVVHIDGEIKLEPEFDKICKNLIDLSRKFEGDKGWKFFLPEDLKSPEVLVKAITAFVITPSKVTAKFKLNQNRPEMDQLGVIAALESSHDIYADEIVKLMKKNLKVES